MKTLNKPKEKTVRRFRVKIGESFAALDYSLHDKGVLVECSSEREAHIFNRNVDAESAIQRTYKKQSEIRGCMFPQWKRFDALKYTAALTVDELSVIVALE